MLKKLTDRLFPFLIAVSALSVSASAAFYSVSGLSKLFAGAQLEVIIMAGSLEFAKLVIASLLYQYRNTIPKALKYYLTIACVVLVLITSMGIYGFLSAAYQETANKEGNRDAQITLIETKRDNVKGQLEVYIDEKSAIDVAVKELRKGLSNNKVQWRDKETGQIITSTSSKTRKALERQLDQAIGRQEVINEKVDVLNEKLFNFESEIVETKIGDGSAGELGPLKYLAGLTGIPMDRIINYLLLVIIFVFDPLAISLVIAANFAFEKLNKKENLIIEDEENILSINSPLQEEEEEDEWGSEGPPWYDEDYEEDNLTEEESTKNLNKDEKLTEEEEEWKKELELEEDLFKNLNSTDAVFKDESWTEEDSKMILKFIDKNIDPNDTIASTAEDFKESLSIDSEIEVNKNKEDDLLDQATKLKEKEQRDNFLND